MRRILYFLLTLSLCTPQAFGQALDLDGYIKMGLENNLVVREKNLSLQKALNGLKSAKSLYLPQIGFDFTYSHADGGRSIDLPVGDMLNPVYMTLNHLTQSDNFPSIENEQINFLPKHYYDTKIRTTVPLFNRDIAHNQEIQKNIVEIHESEVEIYKRELVRSIKEAYYNYAMSMDALTIYESNLQLAEEAKRVNRKLYDVGKLLPVYLVRSDAEISQVKSKLAEAEENANKARLYFNMLLNRDAGDTIHLSDEQMAGSTADFGYVPGDIGYDKREELSQSLSMIKISKQQLSLSKDVFLPKINLFADIGAQAERMRFDRHAPYYMLGAQLSLPIFTANQNKLKIQKNKIAVLEAENKREQLRSGLENSLAMTKQSLHTAKVNLKSAGDQLKAAQDYNRLIQKGFQQGVNTFIETVDARNQLTMAKMAHNISKYRLLIVLAEWERETASYPLKKTQN